MRLRPCASKMWQTLEILCAPALHVASRRDRKNNVLTAASVKHPHLWYAEAAALAETRERNILTARARPFSTASW